VVDLDWGNFDGLTSHRDFTPRIIAPFGAVPTPVDIGLCKKNQDCINSTYCCKDFSCADPKICLHGGKQVEDICDFNFECMSRCCQEGQCSHPL